MKMHRVKLPGKRLVATGFNRQAAGLQIRIAILNGNAALGIPVTEAVGGRPPGMGATSPSTDLCSRAPHAQKMTAATRAMATGRSSGICRSELSRVASP